MTREAYKISEDETIQYAFTSAVEAGDVLFLSGIGVIIAQTAGDADETIAYAKKGVFQFPITSAVTVSQGDKCYWDYSANKVITSGMVAGSDFYLGRAVDAGTASGGYVNVSINANPIDFVASDGTLAKEICVAADTVVCTGATTQLHTATGVLSTDRFTAVMISEGATANAMVRMVSSTIDGFVRIIFDTAPTSAGVSWAAFRAV